jgi:hypothetical protein
VKKKKGWKPFSSLFQNNLTQDSKGNEESGYLVPDSNKKKINEAKGTKRCP